MSSIPERLMAIFLTVVMITVVPMVSFFQRQDDVTYNYVFNEVNIFVEEILDLGMITEGRYLQFAEDLGATGHAFEIRLKHDKKQYVPDPSSPGGFTVVYESYYNRDILDDGIYASGGGQYVMSKGDMLTVQVVNKSTTFAEAAHNVFSETDLQGTINVRIGGMVANEGH